MKSNSFIIILFCFTIILCDSDIDYRAHLSTKSLYYPLDNQYLKPPDHCVLKHVQYVGRHGERLLKKSQLNNINKMLNEMNKNKEKLPEKFKFLGDSSLLVRNLDVASELTMMGEDSLYNIAKRLIKVDSEFYNATYKLNDYYFRATTVTRTLQSGSVFAFSMFEGKGNGVSMSYAPVPLYLVPGQEDLTLRFFDNCPIFDEDILQDKSHVLLQSQTYYNNQFQSIVDKISNKLNMQLTNDNVTTLFDLCITEIQCSNTTVSCTLFEKDDFEMYEYYQDLKYYWQRSYGQDINWQIATPLLKDLLNRFAEISGMNVTFNGNKGNKGEFFFGHAETILPLYSILGLFKDKYELKADFRNDSRLFKTSQISPFAGNIYFKLYDCGNNSQSPSNYYISLQVNEKQMAFPQCKEEDTINKFYCKFETIYSHFNSTIFSTFDFNKTCEVEEKCPLKGDFDVLKTKMKSLQSSNNVSIFFNVFLSVLVVAVSVSFLVFYRRVKKDGHSYEISLQEIDKYDNKNF